MSRLDGDLFREISKRALEAILDRIVGAKILVLDPVLAGPLGLVTEVGLLKDHGVTRMFWLENGGPLAQTERNLVFLCRPEAKTLRLLAEQVKSTMAPNIQMHLLVVPRMTVVAEKVLSDCGVLGSLDIQEFQMGLVPIENDLLSLELEDSWRKVTLEHDFSPVHELAKAFMVLQRACGRIPRVLGKGDAAERLARALERLQTEQQHLQASSVPSINSPIDSLIVLDRHVDLITALCTQLTYEGLVDEVIGIKNSHVEVEPNLGVVTTSTSSPADPRPQKRKKHLLSSSDPLFTELRDQNFAVVGSILNKTARRLHEDYERRHQAKTVTEIKHFVGQLGGLQTEHQALRLHTNLTEQVTAVTATEEFNAVLEVQQNLVAGVELPKQEQTIRDLISRGAPVLSVLRLVCLLSIVTGGLKPKVLEEFKRDILQAYGYQRLPLLVALQTAELLSVATTKKPVLPLLRKPLRLIVDEVDEQRPTDIAYVFSGYAPLGVRLVQCAIGPGKAVAGWKSIEDVLKNLPGPSFDETYAPFDHSQSDTVLPTTIVCFVGGITYAEMAAIRFLSTLLPNRNILVVTTDIITGSSLVR